MALCRPRWLVTIGFLAPLLACRVSPSWAQLPTSYDLRSVTTGSGTVAWVSSIQNQGTAEDCWTFASATAMDSNLLKSGLLQTGSVAPAPAVSSWHLSVANGNPNQLNPAVAFTNGSNWGGFEYMALGYATRGAGQWTIPGSYNPATHVTTFGGGPVSNSSPANAFPAAIANYTGNDADFTPNPITPLLPPVNQPTAWRVTNVAIYDQGFSSNVVLPSPSGTRGGYVEYSYTLGAADPQVQVVKSAILANGAVTTSMNANGNFISASNATGSPTLNTIYYSNDSDATGNSDHEVTIIGWDDTRVTYSDATTISGTGAWLVQNSWGTSFYSNTPSNYSDGTFWASYNDAVIGRTGVASFQLASMAPYGQTVLQNELGPMAYAEDFAVVAGAPDDQTGWVGSPTGMGTVSASSVMSILTPGTDTPLAALGMATQIGGVTVTASIYQWNPATQAFGPLMDQVTTSNSTVGFFLASLSQPLSLTGGQPYAVRLDYALSGSAVLGAAPVTIGGSGINGYLDVTAGLSYYLDPGTSQWIDMGSLAFAPYSGAGQSAGGILFLKGYTTSIPELDLDGVGGPLAIAVAALALFERHRRRAA